MRPDMSSRPESLLEAFDVAWRQPEPPRLEDYLPPAADPERQVVLVGLVGIDLERRIKRGEPARVDAYLVRFPELCAADDVVAELRRLEQHFRQRYDSVGVGEESPTRLSEGVDPRPLAAPAAAMVPVGRAVTEPEVMRSGSVIAGRYQLLHRIGEGGMGTVWMAEQTEPVRRCLAVKLIRADHGSSGDILARFEVERQAIALMDHPHIAKLLDAGTTEAGSPFFAMELVKGVPLTDFCDQYRLTIAERLTLFMQVCVAVQHAHQKGIMHRDLKPSNILVEQHDGKPMPRIIDFGLAKATSGMALTANVGLTGLGAIAGTPLYMAPEQAQGNAIDVDTRVDVYALGVILYELLTGTTPLTRETLREAPFDEMLRLIREQEPSTPSSRLSRSDAVPTVAYNRRMEPGKLGRFVRGELDWIVMKALARERERRYDAPAALARDLERFLAHEPVTAGPPSRTYRLKKFVRRHRPQVLAAAAALVLMVVIVLGSLQHSIQLGEALDETRKERARAVENEQRAQQNEQRARQTQYASDLRLGYQMFKLGDVFLLDQLLERHAPGAADPGGFDWRFLARFRQSSPVTWQAHRMWSHCLAYSPDGQLLAVAGRSPEGGSVLVWSNATRQLTSRIPVHNWNSLESQSIAFSPGANSWIAVCDGNAVSRWDPWTGQAVGKPFVHADLVSVVAVSSDGRRLITGGNGPITLWDVAADEPTARLPIASSGQATSLAPAPNGRTLFTYQPGDPNPYKQWDLATAEAANLSGDLDWSWGLFASPRGTLVGLFGKVRIVLRDDRGHRQDNWLHSLTFRPTAAAVSADDRLLALGCADGGVRFYDLTTRKPHGFLHWQTRALRCLRFAPDGATFAACTEDGTVYQAHVPVSHDPDTLRPTLNATGPLAYAPDGKMLAVADEDRTIKLVDTTTGAVRTVLQGNLNSIDRIAFSFDGRLLAALSGDEVHLFNLSTGKQRFLGNGNDLAFSPATSLLAIGDKSGRIRFCNDGAPSAPGSIQAHSLPITALAFSSDGQVLASASTDFHLRLWDCSGERAAEKPLSNPVLNEVVVAMAFLPGDRILVTGGYGNCVRFWHLGDATLTEVKKPLPCSGPITQLLVSPDGQTLLTQGPHQLPIQWDLNTLAIRQRLPMSTPTAVGVSHRVVPSPRGDNLASFDGETGRIEFWKPGTWKAQSVSNQRLGPVLSLAFTADGQSLVTGCVALQRVIRTETTLVGKAVISETRLLRSAASTIREWRPEDGSERPALSGPEVMAPPALLALSSDDRILAAGGEDGTVFLWDRSTGQFCRRLFVGSDAEAYVPKVELARLFGTNPHYHEAVRSLAFCPGSPTLVTASTLGVVTVWDASDGRQVRRWTVDPLKMAWVGFSPSGDLVLSEDSQLKFVDPFSGASRSTFATNAEVPIVTVAFSRDGSLLAIADQNRRIRLWDRQTGKEKAQLVGHMDQVNALAFSPDHKVLASGSSDRTVKVWSVPVAQELMSLEAHQGHVTCLAFNPAGTILVTGGEGPRGRGEVYLWRAPLLP